MMNIHVQHILNSFKKIRLTGDRDPRGHDIDIEAKVTVDDEIHVTIYKTDRCYKFKKMIDHPGCTVFIYE